MRKNGKQCSKTGVRLEDTGFGYTLSAIGGKYKMIILFWIVETGPVLRFNELKRKIGTISFKTLAASLRELEADGIVERKAYAQIPPKVGVFAHQERRVADSRAGRDVRLGKREREVFRQIAAAGLPHFLNAPYWRKTPEFARRSPAAARCPAGFPDAGGVLVLPPARLFQRRLFRLLFQVHYIAVIYYV